MTARFVRGLADVGAADTAWAGGKAAALGELARAEIPVPRGYVITVAAFNLVMTALDPSGAIRGALGDVPADDLAAIAHAAADLRARITAAPLPPEVAAEITSAYQRLGAQQPDEMAVAVRSSATMEDSPEASFAGLQDSYLAVRGAGALRSGLPSEVRGIPGVGRCSHCAASGNASTKIAQHLIRTLLPMPFRWLNQPV